MLTERNVEWEDWYDRVESEVSESIKRIIENEKANLHHRVHEGLQADGRARAED
jgi:hypothetical protein